jgi:hypothetical protein
MCSSALPGVLGGQVSGDGVGHLGLGRVGRGDTHGDDQIGVQIGQDVAFVAVDQGGAGLAAVPHVRVLDADPPVPGHPPA